MPFSLLHKDPSIIEIEELKSIDLKMDAVIETSKAVQHSINSIVYCRNWKKSDTTELVKKHITNLHQHLNTLRELLQGSLHELELVEKAEK